MTRDEFDHQKNRPCQACGSRVTIEHNPNNNAQQVVCLSSECRQRRTPWGGIPINIKQHNRKNRKDYPMGASIAEVWERFKNRCVVCTLPMGALSTIGVGLSRHHVTERYDPEEYDCPIVPVCNLCKSFVDARQREAWHWTHRLQELTREPVPPGRERVSHSRLSPDSVPAKGQAPARPVEGLPDDYADF